jgi:dCMP deaminase
MADPKKGRIGWHDYFMNIAEQVATRSTCDRKSIGCVIVRDKTILSTGYNGSVRGGPHCDEVGHDMENDHCVRTTHAEANAVAQAAKHGVGIDASEAYVTASPCLSCFKLLVNAGITTIYYKEFYRDHRITTYAKEAGIKLFYMGAESKDC